MTTLDDNIDGDGSKASQQKAPSQNTQSKVSQQKSPVQNASRSKSTQSNASRNMPPGQKSGTKCPPYALKCTSVNYTRVNCLHVICLR
jgi:hypothetical protein